MSIRKKLMAAVLVITMGLAFTACGSKENEDREPYEKVLDTLCNSKAEGDLDEMMTVFGSMETMMRSAITPEVMADTKANYDNECGDNVKVSYKVSKADKADENDLADFKSILETFGSGEDVSEAYNLEVDVTAKGDDGEYNYMMTLSVGKVDGEWIVVNFDDTLLK